MSQPTLHDCGGHVDDLIATVLLWLAPDVDLQAIGVTNSDCYADQAYEALVKIATYLDLEGAEIAVCPEEMPNPFPDSWRRESHIINELPLFGENYLKEPYQQGRPRRTEAVFGDCLSNSRVPLQVVTTGPLTNLAKLLKDQPEVAGNIKELIAMIGAINAPGNVEEEGHDGSAEWNAYADPFALKAVLDTKIPIKLITLDLTNQLPVTKEFLARLESQSSSKASKLASTLWSLVKGFEYYFWNTVTVAAAMQSSLFTFKEMKIDVSTSGKNQGRTATSLFGRKVQVATQIDKAAFEDLLLEVLSLR